MPKGNNTKLAKMEKNNNPIKIEMSQISTSMHFSKNVEILFSIVS